MALLGASVLIVVYRDPATLAALNVNSLIPGAALLLLLFSAGCYALAGMRHGNIALLVVVALYYCALLYQNATLLNGAGPLLDHDGQRRLLIGSARHALALTFIAWATLSARTRRYLLERRNFRH